MCTKVSFYIGTSLEYSWPIGVEKKEGIPIQKHSKKYNPELH